MPCVCTTAPSIGGISQAKVPIFEEHSFKNLSKNHDRNAFPTDTSSTNLGSLYKGVVKDMFTNFKHLRKTRHTHHPVDDARGNAEALLQIVEKYGLKISLK
jgi:hypothetical protein